MGLFSDDINFARRELQRKREASNSQFEPRREKFAAQIVRFNGNLRVPNKEGYVYAREFSPTDTDPPFEVFNNKVQAREGLRVFIGPGVSGRLEILDWDTGTLADLPEYQSQTYLPITSSDFEWPDFNPGPNALNIYPRSRTELRCYPGEAGGLTISVAPFRYIKNNNVTLFAGVTSQSISSSKPSGTNEARFVGVYLDLSDGAIKTVDGAVSVDSPSTVPDSPVFPADNIVPICLVRLDDQQTSVTESDFVDARQFINNPASSQLYTPDLATKALSIDSNGDATMYPGNASLGNIYVNWTGYKLRDETEGQLFTEYASATPTGWTEIDGAVDSNTTRRYGFWFLKDGTSWKFNKQSTLEIESLASNFWASFLYGPILFKDGDFSGDVHYRLGIYADDSGSIDEDIFTRINLYWNSGSNIWQVRGEGKDGTTQTNGTYKTLSFPYAMPLYFRLVIRNHTTAGSRKVRVYIGTSPEPDSHSLLQDLTFSATWSDVWWQIQQTKAGGVADGLFIGAVDYLGNKA